MRRMLAPPGACELSQVQPLSTVRNILALAHGRAWASQQDANVQDAKRAARAAFLYCGTVHFVRDRCVIYFTRAVFVHFSINKQGVIHTTRRGDVVLFFLFLLLAGFLYNIIPWRMTETASSKMCDATGTCSAVPSLEM